MSTAAFSIEIVTPILLSIIDGFVVINLSKVISYKTRSCTNPSVSTFMISFGISIISLYNHSLRLLKLGLSSFIFFGVLNKSESIFF